MSTGGAARRAPVSDATARVIAAVRDGDGGELFPPVAAEGPERLLVVTRWLGGDADARALERQLARPRFGPLRDALEALQLECARWRRGYGALFAPAILQLVNPRLFGALIAECYTACALAPRPRANDVVAQLQRGFAAAFQRFLTRLARDLDAGVLGRPARGEQPRRTERTGRSERPERPERRDAAPPAVTALRAHLAETHNGRQFALEVRLRGGATWMYKPRPGDGERLLLGRGDRGARAGAPVSLFEQLNRLRPAAGAPRLPTLQVVRGRGSDARWYSWHEWIEPPRRLAVVRELEGRGQRHELRACRLAPRRAADFWYRAGCVSAACLAFGATDLFAENVKLGRRRGDAELWPYPVDLEMIGYPLRRLAETGLLGGGGGAPHPGLGQTPSWRADDGPLAFHRVRRGQLELVRDRRAWARGHAGELVGDTAGTTGYAAYLTAYLRGLFDLWITVLQRRRELHAFLAGQPAPWVRVVVRPTASYAAALDAALTGERPPRQKRQARPASSPAWSAEERAQLQRLDVPYFLCLAGGPLCTLPVSPRQTRPVRAGAQPRSPAHRAPLPMKQRLDEPTLAMLGVALRDAVEHVAAALPYPHLADRRRGVEVVRGAPGRGAVTIGWREAGQRLRFHWREREVHVEVSPLAAARAAAPAIRRQLLRLDRLDRVMRQRFQESGFADRATERTLEGLVAAAVAWLEEVLAEHGWPGRSLVGERAAAAACRLVQHADRFAAFQRRCLRLVEEAVGRGEATPRQLAYLTDQVRLRAGRKQLYGTKFRRHRGELLPFPIEDAAGVDRRRRQAGLGTLESYARRIRRLFGAAPPPGAAAKAGTAATARRAGGARA